MASAAPTTIFSLTPSPPPGAPTDPILGLWEFAGGSAQPASSPSPAASNGAVVWRVDLATDTETGIALLTESETRTRIAEFALGLVPPRLLPVVAPPPAGLSFAPGQTALGGAPELTLRDSLAALSAATPAVDFAPGLGTGIWRDGFDALTGALADARRIISHLAWVETRTKGRLVARTQVDWRGNSRTFWLGHPESGQGKTHGRAVSLAVATRLLTIRAIVLALRGAALVGSMLTPATLPMALPLAWRFVKDVLDEAAHARAVWQGRLA
ncbi:MAG TPA: hypothetical protein VH482_30075 [Thermomicrobiales bacterium]|jgi:hypothetical protein